MRHIKRNIIIAIYNISIWKTSSKFKIMQFWIKSTLQRKKKKINECTYLFKAIRGLLYIFWFGPFENTIFKIDKSKKEILCTYPFCFCLSKKNTIKYMYVYVHIHLQVKLFLKKCSYFNNSSPPPFFIV